jgi:hypothetical protein
MYATASSAYKCTKRRKQASLLLYVYCCVAALLSTVHIIVASFFLLYNARFAALENLKGHDKRVCSTAHRKACACSTALFFLLYALLHCGKNLSTACKNLKAKAQHWLRQRKNLIISIVWVSLILLASLRIGGHRDYKWVLGSYLILWLTSLRQKTLIL